MSTETDWFLRKPDNQPMLDVAVVGAGVGGAYVANEVLRRHPAWSVELFERTTRVGGRLQSLAVVGDEHPIELGGMRYLSGHQRVAAVVSDLGLPTHPFDIGRGPDRLVLRGVIADGADNPRSGAAYRLAEDEAGRSAGELIAVAFNRIVPGALEMSADDWRRQAHELRLLDRPLADWSIGDALASVLSVEACRFVSDAFGYDSGLRGLNAADAIPYLLAAGYPRGEARTPDAGMAGIPTGLVSAFRERGGHLRLEHELTAIVTLADNVQRLVFANGATVSARRVVLAVPAPALRRLAPTVDALATDRVRAMIDSVDAWEAAKLYLWFRRAWWRESGFQGMRLTTDLSPRKIFAFDEPGAGGLAVLLAAYTDGRDVAPWTSLTGSAERDGKASPAVIEAAMADLQAVFPTSAEIPEPLGSAFKHWGADPLECGWHYWRAGVDSERVISEVIQPDTAHRLYICGEAYSRWQAWVEGALETAAAVVERLTFARD